EAVSLFRFDVLFHDLAFEIVEDVAVTIENEAALRPVRDSAATTSEERLAIAALTMPHDALSVSKLERGVLRVGKLPVVRVVKASAVRLDARRKIDAEREPGDVDLVRAVVVDLARAPASEPVPVVVDVVVVIRRARRRTLPELVIEIRRN